MKSFKQMMSEVAQPAKSKEEKAFKDMHSYETKSHPVAPDAVFTGDIGKPKASRPADQEGDANYDKQYLMKRESAEELDEAKRKGAPKMTGDSIAIQRAKDAEHNKAMGRTRTGRKKPVRTMTSTQRSLASMRNEESEDLEEKKGLWDNIHAKRKRIKNGSGERMRKPGSKGAPTDQDFKDASESVQVDEVSTQKLMKYRDKARGSLQKSTKSAMASSVRGDKEGFKRDTAAMNKREKGLKMADRAAARNFRKEDLDETTTSALKKPVTQTGPDGKTRTVMKKTKTDNTDDHGQDVMGTNEADVNALAKAATGGKAKIKESVKASVAKGLAKAGEVTKDGKKAVTLKKAPWEKNEEYVTEETCSCCDTNIDSEGKCGCDADCPHCGGQHDVSEALKGGQKELDHNNNGKIDGHDFKLMRKKKKNESVELDEISKNKMGQYIKRAHDDKDTQKKRASIFDKKGMDSDKDKDMYNNFAKADRAKKKAANRTKFIGKAVDRMTKESVKLDELSKKTLGSYTKKASSDLMRSSGKAGFASGKGVNKSEYDKQTDRAEKRKAGIKTAVDRMTKESAEQIDEATKFKKGPIKLKDGSQEMVSAQDAQLLTQLFKDLSPANQRQMEKVAMTDKAGFKEILGFAREAL